MLSRVVVCMTICLYASRGEGDFECIPGTTLPHPNDCNKYFLCDDENDRSLFVCPWDLLYNPATANCDLAEKVTCFEGSEQASTEDSDKEEEAKDKTKPEEAADTHKEFYLVEDSSDESFESDEQDRDKSSNRDEESQKMYYNQRSSEEDKNTSVKSKISKYQGKNSEDREHFVKPLFDRTDKWLDKESDEPEPNLSIDSREQFVSEINKEEYESTETQTDPTKIPLNSADPESFAGEDRADDTDQIDRLSKRDISEKGVASKGDGSETDKDPEDVEHKDEYGRKESVVHDEDLGTKDTYSSSTSHEESFHVTNVNGTNFLRVEDLEEPIANWTEHLENGWTDLQIFWKHPKDEDFQGAVNFRYPTDSMSSELEIQDLVMEVLRLKGDEAEAVHEDMVEDSSQISTDEKDTK